MGLLEKEEEEKTLREKMRAQFRLSHKTQKGEVLKENPLTVIARVAKGLGHKFIKRHKIKHNVEILKGRKDLDIGVEGKSKRKDLEL